MKIESQSLAAYLFGIGMAHQDTPPAPPQSGIEDIWRAILRFPGESWSPIDDGGGGPSILDPARVLGRMFCVKLDRYLSPYLYQTLRVEGKQLKVNVPLSWLLRMAPDDSWRPGDVLIYAEKKSGGVLDDEIREIKKFFPNLFYYLREKKQRDSSIENLNTLLAKTWTEFKGRDLIHVSAPKFHKSWTDLVGEDRQKEEDAKKAKQQWSMSVDGHFEKLCYDSTGGCEIIQSGGGHVLLLAPKDSDSGKVAKDELEFIQEKFVELGGRGWSPLLWASWEDDSIKMQPRMEVDVEELIGNLCENYDKSESSRYSIKENWAFFKYGREIITERNTERPAIIYLDVIGLGEHCWPSTEKEQQNGKPPIRKRGDTITGFKRSRNITAVIESTFGLIFAKHLPGKVLAMGGDEITMEMDASEWLGVVLNIEEHCKNLHATIFEEEARLLWWAMCSEGNSVPDSDYIRRLKDEYRKLTEEDRVQLTRFVNPMWTNIGGQRDVSMTDSDIPEDTDWDAVVWGDVRIAWERLSEAKLRGYDLDEGVWVDWKNELTVDRLADDLFDTTKIPMFDESLREDSMSSGKWGGTESIKFGKIWKIIGEDISRWEKEEYDKLSDDQKNLHTGNLRAWTTLLDESVEEVWKRTELKTGISQKMKRRLRKIACCFLTRRYGMKSSDFKEWKKEDDG